MGGTWPINRLVDDADVIAVTNLRSHAASRVDRRAMALGNRLFAQDDVAGALPVLHAAEEDLPGGSCVAPTAPPNCAAPRRWWAARWRVAAGVSQEVAGGGDH